MRHPALVFLLASLLMIELACGGEAVPHPAEADTGSQAAPPVEPAPATGPRIRVVGTAQDGGFPHAACDCRRCTLARTDPQIRRPVASLAIVVPPKVYLIDATPDVREQLMALEDVRDRPRDAAGGVDRAPVDGIFLTHAHIGHYLGLAFFGFEAVHTRDLPVYGTASMADFLAANGPWDQLLKLGNIRTVTLTPGGQGVDLGEGVTVQAIAVPHRHEYTDTVAYRIRGPEQTVLYIPDCDPWHAWSEEYPALGAGAGELLEGVDVALLDGSFYSGDELPGRDLKKIGHPLVADSMDRLQDLAARAAGPRIYFTHFNHSNPVLDPAHPARSEVEARGFHIADDGLEIPL